MRHNTMGGLRYALEETTRHLDDHAKDLSALGYPIRATEIRDAHAKIVSVLRSLPPKAPHEMDEPYR